MTQGWNANWPYLGRGGEENKVPEGIGEEAGVPGGGQLGGEGGGGGEEGWRARRGEAGDVTSTKPSWRSGGTWYGGGGGNAGSLPSNDPTVTNIANTSGSRQPTTLSAKKQGHQPASQPLPCTSQPSPLSQPSNDFTAEPSKPPCNSTHNEPFQPLPPIPAVASQPLFSRRAFKPAKPPELPPALLSPSPPSSQFSPYQHLLLLQPHLPWIEWSSLSFLRRQPSQRHPLSTRPPCSCLLHPASRLTTLLPHLPSSLLQPRDKGGTHGGCEGLGVSRCWKDRRCLPPQPPQPIREAYYLKNILRQTARGIWWCYPGKSGGQGRGKHPWDDGEIRPQETPPTEKVLVQVRQLRCGIRQQGIWDAEHCNAPCEKAEERHSKSRGRCEERIWKRGHQRRRGCGPARHRQLHRGYAGQHRRARRHTPYNWPLSHTRVAQSFPIFFCEVEWFLLLNFHANPGHTVRTRAGSWCTSRTSSWRSGGGSTWAPTSSPSTSTSASTSQSFPLHSSNRSTLSSGQYCWIKLCPWTRCNHFSMSHSYPPSPCFNLNLQGALPGLHLLPGGAGAGLLLRPDLALQAQPRQRGDAGLCFRLQLRQRRSRDPVCSRREGHGAVEGAREARHRGQLVQCRVLYAHLGGGQVLSVHQLDEVHYGPHEGPVDVCASGAYRCVRWGTGGFCGFKTEGQLPDDAGSVPLPEEERGKHTRRAGEPIRVLRCPPSACQTFPRDQIRLWVS